MPDSERDSERLSREAVVLLGAGTATTARTMASFRITLSPIATSRKDSRRSSKP